MASHRRPKPPSRARVTVLTAAAATAVALSAQVANAAPAKPSKDEVKAQVDALYEQQEQASEVYDGAKERADQLHKQADQLQDQIARAQDQLTQLTSGLGAVAGEQYRAGGIDPSMALMLSSNPSQYLEQASSAEQATATQAEQLKSLKDQQRRLDQQKQEAAATLAELDRSTQVLNDAKAQVQQKLKEAQALLSTLTRAEQASIMGDRASRGGSRYAFGDVPPVSGYAGVAVKMALSKQGDPYKWGATGPNEFDCSGLMQWAYAQAGVSIPRTSQEQATAGTAVSLADAQPGDLVVFYSDRHHVGMYIGNGLVVHAPRTGEDIRTMPVNTLPISTIRRI